MRRKCLTAVCMLLTVLYLLDAAGIPLQPETVVFTGTTGTYEGIVSRVRQKEEDTYLLRIRLVRADGKKLPHRTEVLLSCYDNISQPWELIGAVLTFDTILEKPQEAGNPHCFDYADYLKSCGISAVGKLAASDLSFQKRKTGIVKHYERFLMKQKFIFSDRLRAASRGILMGVLFGETDDLDEAVYRQFREAGTAHILAVSGLHIGILYELYRRMTKDRLYLRNLIFLGFLLFTYGTLSGWSTSTVRASTMIILRIVARIFDLRYDMLTALSISALILILQNPYVIIGTAFQMSFLAISSIAVFTRILPRAVPTFLSAPIAVNLGLAVYQIYQFHSFSPISLAANIPILYLSGWLVPSAMLCFAVSVLINGSLLQLLLSLLQAMAELLLRVNGLFGMQGYASFDFVRPPLWIALFVGTGMFFAASETCLLLYLRKQKKQILCCFTGLFLFAVVLQGLTYSPITHDDLVFIDVGQGDAVHLRCEGKEVLIDGGGSVRYNIGEKILKPYFLANGAGKIDLALATHLHTDHYLAQSQLAEIFPLRKQLSGLTAATTIEISKRKDVWIETLWPISLAKDEKQDENSSCSVFLVHWGSFRILITGDLDEEGESEMLSYYRNSGKLRADVLKVGHHGSRTSTTEAFLDAVKPQIAVIQVGKNNYGHPSPETLQRLAEREICVYRNDLNGAIGMKFRRNGKIRVDCMLAG